VEGFYNGGHARKSGTEIVDFIHSSTHFVFLGGGAHERFTCDLNLFVVTW
jgi:hypothetical protein